MNGRHAMKYKKDQLTFSSFHVWYKFKAASQQLLNSWEGKRMTGFRLSWRIDPPSVENVPSPDDASQSVIQTPKYKQHILAKVAQLVQQLRIGENLTKEQILNKIILEKIKHVNILETESMCSNGQVTPDHMNSALSKLVPYSDENDIVGLLTDIDIARLSLQHSIG